MLDEILRHEGRSVFVPKVVVDDRFRFIVGITRLGLHDVLRTLSSRATCQRTIAKMQLFLTNFLP